jgi:hypothetical protein
MTRVVHSDIHNTTGFASEVTVVVQVWLHIHIVSEMFVCLLCAEFH